MSSEPRVQIPEKSMVVSGRAGRRFYKGPSQARSKLHDPRKGQNTVES